MRYNKLWRRRSQGRALVVFLTIHLDAGISFEDLSVLKFTQKCDEEGVQLLWFMTFSVMIWVARLLCVRIGRMRSHLIPGSRLLSGPKRFNYTCLTGEKTEVRLIAVERSTKYGSCQGYRSKHLPLRTIDAHPQLTDYS